MSRVSVHRSTAQYRSVGIMLDTDAKSREYELTISLWIWDVLIRLGR